MNKHFVDNDVLKLLERDNNLIGHVEVDSQPHEETECSGRLGNIEQVDDRVEDASPGKQSVMLLLRERTQLAWLT